MTTQWTNIDEDAGALHALLHRVAEHVAIDLIEDIWIFPPRKTAAGESIVIVVGARGEDADRRRVITAHFTVMRNKKGIATVNARFDEHGTAPGAAVLRIVQGVLRRLGEDADASPREDVIAGSRDRWDALIVDTGGTPKRTGDAADGEAEGEAEGEARAATTPAPGTPAVGMQASAEPALAGAGDAGPASAGSVEQAAVPEPGEAGTAGPASEASAFPARSEPTGAGAALARPDTPGQPDADARG